MRKEVPRWKAVISWLMIFMVTEAYKLVPSMTFVTIYFNAFLLLGWFAFFNYIVKYNFSTVSWWLIGYCVIFPIYGSIKSEILFGQNFWLGVASLRYLSFIMTGFILILMRYPYSNLIKQINTFNLILSGLSVFLILILQISPGTITSLFVDTNIVQGGGEVADGYHAVRGMRFAKCSELIYVSLIYYTLCIIRYGFKKNYTLSLLLLLVYMLFVHKGRQPIAVMCIVYVIAYVKYRCPSFRKFMLTVIPVVVLFVIIMVFPNIIDSFTVALQGEKSRDFSTLARMWSVNSVWPYIEDNPVLGIGNLSAHYKEGFHRIFGITFYIADIGIYGALARGGIVLILIYTGLYLSLYGNTSCISNIENRRFLRYMILVQVCLLVLFFHDTLNGAGSMRFALILYPLFASKNVLRKTGICSRTI